jgi:TfoX/Sxy family transcriptional regulator of competence genes
MSYDVDLAERIRQLMAGTAVTEKKMFGGLAFLVSGHMAVAASARGGLLVRVDPAEMDHLLDEPGTAPMTMGRRGPMNGWLHVTAGAVTDDACLERWVRSGTRRATSLPAD